MAPRVERGVLLALALALGCSESDTGAAPGPKPAPDAAADASDADASTADASDAAATCPSIAASASDQPFAPRDQTPFFEKGLVLPPLTLPCTPVPGGPSQTECFHHSSSIAELADGTIAVAWYTGESERSPDSRLVWARKSPGAADFAPPETLIDDPGNAEGNVALWVDEGGTIYVFYAHVIDTSTWDDVRPRMIRSRDGGATFSAPVVFREKPCWMNRNKPIRLKSGDILLPLFDNCIAVPVYVRSSDDFETFELQEPDVQPGFVFAHIEEVYPALIQRADGTVVTFAGDGKTGSRVRRLTSSDDGRNWSNSELTELSNAHGGIDAARLANGHVVVLFDANPVVRFPLAAALSVDEGTRFQAVRNVDDECPAGFCAFAYPSVVQSRDGTIWVSYTHDGRSIAYAHFNEAWLAEGGDTSRVACRPFETCRENLCLPVCGTDSECLVAGSRCEDGVCQRTCTSPPCCDLDCDDAGRCTPNTLARCEPE